MVSEVTLFNYLGTSLNALWSYSFILVKIIDGVKRGRECEAVIRVWAGLARVSVVIKIPNPIERAVRKVIYTNKSEAGRVC